MPPEINNKEAIDMMSRCKQEILNLRAEINMLRPKAEAYDNLATLLRLLPRPSVGASEDLVWILDKRMRELKPTPEALNPAEG